VKAHLTAKFIRSLPFEPNKPKFITDRNLRGFGVKILRQSKVFYFEKRIQGKPKRVTIGPFPDLTLEEARQVAHFYHAELAKGRNPFEKKETKATSPTITLRQAYENYFIIRTNLRPGSLKSMRGHISRYLKAWFDTPVLDITPEMVLEKHRFVTVNHGPTVASYSFRYLRAILNLAKVVHKKRPGFSGWENPVRILTETRAWNPRKRRNTVIPKEKLGQWFNAVLEVQRNAVRPTVPVVCDFYLFLVLTGMRRTEAISLTWDDVSLEDGYVLIKPEITKNHAPHQLPFSDYLQALMEKRWRERVNEYVFPGKEIDGKARHLAQPRHTAKNITGLCGVKFTNHDLRRTFISIAEYLNINQYAIKRLANHKFNKNDETADYISNKFDAQRLRGPMQQITDFILAQAGLRKSKNNSVRLTLDLEPGQAKRLQTLAELHGKTLTEFAKSALMNFQTEPGRTVNDADAFLRGRGIIGRAMGAYGLPDSLRITIGTGEEMQACVDALAEFAQG